MKPSLFLILAFSTLISVARADDQVLNHPISGEIQITSSQILQTPQTYDEMAAAGSAAGEETCKKNYGKPGKTQVNIECSGGDHPECRVMYATPCSFVGSIISQKFSLTRDLLEIHLIAKANAISGPEALFQMTRNFLEGSQKSLEHACQASSPNHQAVLPQNEDTSADASACSFSSSAGRLECSLTLTALCVAQ